MSHLPVAALPGAAALLLDPAGAQIAAQAFAPRARAGALGPLYVLGGDLIVATPGRGVDVATGTNGRLGAAALVAGAATVNTSAVKNTSAIFLCGQNSSGTAGELSVSARTAGTSFTITSSSATDTRTVAWEIREPA